jgi:ATP-binding cassette subfamily C protein
MTRCPWVRQESAEDCAAASLAIVARHYGRTIRVSRIRAAMGAGSAGTTLSAITAAAEQLGFTTRTIEAGSEFLDRLHEGILPAILHWKGYHFVVLFGKEGDRYLISDPGLGVRKVTRHELDDAWHGRLTILLKPHPLRFPLQKDDTANPLRSLFRALLPFRTLAALILLLSVALALAALAIPCLAGMLGDRILAHKGDASISQIIMVLLALLAITYIIDRTQMGLAHRFELAFSGRLKSDFGARLLDLPISYHQSRGASLVRSRLDDTDRVSAMFTQMAWRLPFSALTACGSAMALAAISLPAMVLAVSLGLAGLGFILLLRPAVRQASYRLHSKTGETFFLLSQFFRGALTIKTLAAGSLLQRELSARLAAGSMKNRVEMGTVAAALSIPALVTNLSLVLFLGFGTYLLGRSDLSLGGLITTTGFSFLFFIHVKMVAWFLIGFAEFRASVQSFEELLDAEPENVDDDQKEWVALPSRGDLVCEGIGFRYPGRPPLFKALALRFPGGKVSALIGPSGCGKTTLAHLLTRLQVPQEGLVRVGAMDLSALPLECLRSQINLVVQEAHFLNRTVMENLTLGKPQASAEEVVAGCRLAEAHDFVSALPQGYETMIGDFSAQLSAGEKQRLALARALIMDPLMLIIDEGTSSLDPPTEARILENLLHRREGKTTILISHRPTVIGRAEWIVLLEQGSIGFEGRLEEFRGRGDFAFLNP